MLRLEQMESKAKNPSVCVDGWNNINGSCYAMVSQQALSRDNASDVCKNQGGYLPSIEYEWEEKYFVKALLQSLAFDNLLPRNATNRTVWIGLRMTRVVNNDSVTGNESDPIKVENISGNDTVTLSETVKGQALKKDQIVEFQWDSMKPSFDDKMIKQRIGDQNSTDCFTIDSDGDWAGISCDSKNFFFCEQNPI